MVNRSTSHSGGLGGLVAVDVPATVDMGGGVGSGRAVMRGEVEVERSALRIRDSSSRSWRDGDATTEDEQ